MYSTLNDNIASETRSPALIEDTVEMYKAPPEFFMTVSSFGGIFNAKSNITNYKERWMNINSQTISTSFISNNNMSTVPIKDVCFGFCEFELKVKKKSYKNKWSFQNKKLEKLLLMYQLQIRITHKCKFKEISIYYQKNKILNKALTNDEI